MNRGVFWCIDDDGDFGMVLLAKTFEHGETVGVSKSGDNYNHKLLWDEIKPKGCNKPYDYYPRGRVEISNKGKPVIYMNPNISEDVIEHIIAAFDISEKPTVHYDGSSHYLCHLDDEYNKIRKK